MNRAGYTIAEVLIAVLVVGIGLTAAATLINSILAQEQLNAAAVRAANVHEQAAMLTRLGLTAAQVRSTLPETVGTTSPGRDNYSLAFSTNNTNIAVSVGGTNETVAMQAVTLTLVYGSPAPGASTTVRLTNTVSVLLPAIR